jgi:2-keto-4-pentenoate hydratase/2-oxohepta-3-ene-1,7-dioic acid hydratase in catechol pathway
VKLVSFTTENRNRIGFSREGEIFAFDELDPGLPTEMKQLLPMWKEIAARFSTTPDGAVPVKNATLRAPIPDPEKVICIGVNYADHASESGSAIPSEPVVFNKFPTAIRAHGENIELPSYSDSVDYEAEMVVVIGAEGKEIPEAEALDYVAGYACGHDVSARDWQKGTPEGQWLCGKSFDSFAPYGPFLVTADDVPDPHNLSIKFRLNGEELQNSNTKQLIFNVNQLIAHVSKVCTLRPGDLIFTGTPPGVGAVRVPPIFMKAGDVAEVEIEQLGVLRNPVVAAPGGAEI